MNKELVRRSDKDRKYVGHVGGGVGGVVYTKKQNV